MSFFLYEDFIKKLESYFKYQSSFLHGVSAAIAVAMVQMMVYPFDVVKKRIIV